MPQAVPKAGKMEVAESLTETLERLIDRHGLFHVIVGLELVAVDKAQLVEAPKDREHWAKVSRRFYALANEFEKEAS